MALGRLIAVLLGLAGGALGSQAPGFTLQYLQNLQGRIDELRPIVEQFDRDIAAYGYNRPQALEECAQASNLLKALCGGYETTILRFEELVAHRDELNAVGEYMRPITLAQTYQPDIVESVYSVFEPAVPATLGGAAYAGGAFAIVWAVFSGVLGLLGMAFGGRREERYA